MDTIVEESGGLHLVLTDQASAQDRDYIDRQIKSFNDATSEHHRQALKAGIAPLDIMIRDGQDRVRGGLVARTYWGWLKIVNIWIEEELRGRGFGHKLLAAAEAEAVARGCSRVWLRTFSFQARGFYEKQGYRIAGQLGDYPPGQTFYWLRKDLSPAD